ncbi:MAG: ATP-binding cassette domain-containing protein [Streptosporangiaceae bacterium]
MTTVAVAARGLGKQYGRRWALSDCTLTIPAGHVVGLVGPNGAGKTTLISLMTGMLAPTTGAIEPRRCTRQQPGTACQGRLCRPGHAHLRRA